MTNRKGKTRPRYEDYGVSRAQLEHDWEQLKAWGYIGDPDEEAERLIRACHEMHFIHSPRDGWAHVARELRIIEFQLPERKRSGSLSRSQMAKKCSSIADQLWEIGSEMSEMAWQEDYTMAALEAKSGAAGGERFEYVNLPGQIVGLVSPLRKLAFWLDLSSNWHSNKHKAFSARERRLVFPSAFLDGLAVGLKALISAAVSATWGHRIQRLGGTHIEMPPAMPPNDPGFGGMKRNDLKQPWITNALFSGLLQAIWDVEKR